MNTLNTDSGRPVMVAVDGSPASLEALREGHRWAQLLNAPIVAVNTWHVGYGLFPPATWYPERDSERMLKASIGEAFHPATPPAIEAVTAEGTPAETLLRLSQDAELLVIGSRGHSGMSGVMLGSVSTICAAHAPCPVLVVHAPQLAGPVVPQAKSEPESKHGLVQAERMVVTL